MIFQKAIFFVCSSVIFLMISCDEKASSENDSTQDAIEEEVIFIAKPDTIISIDHLGNSIEVCIERSKIERVGTILALPGWNYPHNHWCDSTDLCYEATLKGYDVVMPTMGKTIYSENIYDQTRSDWKGEITRSWINDTLIPVLQKSMDVMVENEHNCVFGISTGGRGALLLAMDNPQLFKAGGSLSGDFDMTSFQKDNLYIGYFGNYQSNLELWEGNENPLSRLKELQTPFYIAHGSSDNIVPLKHAHLLYDQLDSNTHTLHVVSEAGHDYDFWSSEITSVLNHFDANRK